MMNSVSNSVIINATSAPSNTNGAVRALPSVNSIVNVNVLDKISGNYKILVGGTLFQSKLPFNAEIGDQLIAKVLTHKPFTLGIDNLSKMKGFEISMLPGMLAKLELKNDAISKLVLKKVMGSNKPIVKAKVKRVIEYLENSDLIIDELTIGLLINIVWNESFESGEEALGSFYKIFDISFEELSQAIYSSLKNLNASVPDEVITKSINTVLLFDPSAVGAKQNLIPIKDKSKEFVQLVKMIGEAENSSSLLYSVSKEFHTLKLLMLKYVLQKSVFSRFDIHPEFTIINAKEGFHLINYKIDRINNNNGELSFNITTLFNRKGYGEFLFNAYSTIDKLSGELAVDIKHLKIIKEKLRMVNENLSKELEIFSGIKVEIKDIKRNEDLAPPVSIKSINTVA